MPGDHRVYVVKNGKKNWVKTEAEFKANCYNWADVQTASAALLAKYPDAQALVDALMKAVGDPRVYIVKNGKKKWIKTAEEFNANGFDWKNVQEVTPDTLAAYSDEDLAAALVKIVNALNLRVRNANTTAGAVLDTVKKGEVYTIVEKKNGWYKIKTKKGKEGWISGNYAEEENEDDEEDD